MQDAINKAARKVIDHCFANNLGIVIFGGHVGMKNGVNMGAKIHQNFVQIPTCRLKTRIAQLCEQYGIRLVKTEESYTSKASFVDLDVLPKFCEKPEGWQRAW
jgi:putative transposase